VILASMVVSNPPHNGVDHGRAAELLGLTPAEMRMKANFRAPEIWLAFADDGQASDAVASLRSTGLSVEVVSGYSLVSIPGPAPVSSFAFTDAEFVAHMVDSELRFPYEAPTLGVFCKPPYGFGSASTAPSPKPSWGRSSTHVFLDRLTRTGHEQAKLGASGALELMANLDLYISVEEGFSRVSITRELVDFSGLGDLMSPGRDANMTTCIAECERLFNQFTLDGAWKTCDPGTG
jgi:hypothetical protein